VIFKLVIELGIFPIQLVLINPADYLCHFFDSRPLSAISYLFSKCMKMIDDFARLFA